jgi:hypothetical protein
MTRTRITLISTTALASMLGAALPALAQAPAPAPMYAPAPVPTYAAPAPTYAAPAPMPEPQVVPVAAPVAPKAADDMSGSIGFGIGVGGGVPGGATGTATNATTSTSLVTANTTSVAMKYYATDSFAILPRLEITMSKTKDLDASWAFRPSVLAMFNVFKGASTRFDAGAGVGIGIAKTPPADATINFNIPVALNVEHFFTRWFSMGLGTQFDFINFSKPGDAWTLNVEISNIRYMGSLFFYTD